MSLGSEIKDNIELINGLEGTIVSSTIETLDQIFGFKIIHSNNPAADYIDSIACYAEFWDVFDTFQVCFIFEKSLILSLIQNIYDRQTMETEQIDELCKDTVCELANIIGNRIKLYLNNNGFNSVMEIPYAEIINILDTEHMAHIVQTNFSAPEQDSQKNIIYIGLKNSN